METNPVPSYVNVSIPTPWGPPVTQSPTGFEGSAKANVHGWRSPAAVQSRLDTLRPAPNEGYTLYLAPEQLSSLPRPLLEAVPDLGSSPTGTVLFGSAQRQLVVLPPFSIGTRPAVTGWDSGPLMSTLQRERDIAVVLLRLGRYAVGVFRGTKLVASKTDTRYVKGKHKAGGTSQLRFQRIRENQARALFDKTCEMARQVFGPYEDSLQNLVLGGERHTLLGLRERCPYLSRFESGLIRRVLEARVPNLETLQKCGPRLYESLLVEVTPPVPLPALLGASLKGYGQAGNISI